MSPEEKPRCEGIFSAAARAPIEYELVSARVRECLGFLALFAAELVTNVLQRG